MNGIGNGSRLRHRRFFLRPTRPDGLGSGSIQGIVILHDRLIVGERTDGEREELTPLTRFSHVCDDAGNQSFVLLFGILLVKDAMFGIPQGDAAEAILTIPAVIAVEKVHSVVNQDAEVRTMALVPHLQTVIALFGRESPRIAVTAILGLVKPSAIIAIFQLAHIEGMPDIARPQDAIASHILVHFPDHEAMRILQAMLFEEYTCLLHATALMEGQDIQAFLVLGLCELLVEEHMFLVREIDRAEAVLTVAAAEEKLGIAAVAALLGVAQVIALRAVDALVAELAVIHKAAVHAVATVVHKVPVETVLVIIGTRNQIAVLEEARGVHKVTVLIPALAHGDRDERYCA